MPANNSQNACVIDAWAVIPIVATGLLAFASLVAMNFAVMRVALAVSLAFSIARVG
ncbi:hypothetical protein D3C71_1976670 [compost metagenome]